MLKLRSPRLRAAILLSFAAACLAEQPPKPGRALFDYIQDARKLGLKDDQIRQNALKAGWDQTAVDRTYRVIGILNNEPISNPGVEGYRIGAGDVLQIIVWKEPDASVPDVVVRADGRISLPLVKELDVAGLTPLELEALLTARIGKLIADPDVTVIAKEINSRKVYMVGAVKKEGPLPLIGPMTVMQAINEAGGLTEYAKRKKIYILREEGGKQTKIPFNYQAVIKGEHMEQNIRLLPGDSVVVPQ
jgi:polysaccharide export outer membrane protein